jgi:hypothetical protein
MRPRKTTLVPLIAATCVIVAGGPFGLEDIVFRAGCAGAILKNAVTPELMTTLARSHASVVSTK